MKEKFQWGPFLKAILVIALPVAFQNLLATTGSMVDTIMLASLGTNTVGAAGLCAQFSSLMFSCYWGFVGGGMLFFAQYWGARDDKGINRSYGLTLVFMMSVAAIFTIFAVAFPDVAMSIYTDKTAIQEIGVAYLRLVGFAYPLQILAMAMSALLRSIERVTIPLYGGIASVITNCTVNYLLIFGKAGFPMMGVRGAAIGTIVAGVVNLLVITIYVIRKKIPYVFSISRHFRWNLPFIREYLRKCFPILCNELLIGVGLLCINSALGHQSEQAIAAVAVFRTLEGIVISFFTGFSSAATVLVGKMVGEGSLETAYQRAKRLVYLCSALTGIVCLTLFLLHNPLLHAMGLSGESYSYGTSLLLIYSVVAVIRMGNWAHNDTFRSAGDAAFGSVMEIAFMYLMVLPILVLSNYVLKLPFLVVFTLCYVDEPIRYVIMQKHMYSGKWMKPVSVPGQKALPAFREAHHITPRLKARAIGGDGRNS